MCSGFVCITSSQPILSICLQVVLLATQTEPDETVQTYLFTLLYAIPCSDSDDAPNQPPVVHSSSHSSVIGNFFVMYYDNFVSVPLRMFCFGSSLQAPPLFQWDPVIDEVYRPFFQA